MSYEIYGDFSIMNAETQKEDQKAEARFKDFADSYEDLLDLLNEGMASGSTCVDRVNNAVKTFTGINTGILVEFRASDSEGLPNYWITYYLNGKMQVCTGEIVYPPYDPAKMVEEEAQS